MLGIIICSQIMLVLKYVLISNIGFISEVIKNLQGNMLRF